ELARAPEDWSASGQGRAAIRIRKAGLTGAPRRAGLGRRRAARSDFGTAPHLGDERIDADRSRSAKHEVEADERHGERELPPVILEERPVAAMNEPDGGARHERGTERGQARQEPEREPDPASQLTEDREVRRDLRRRNASGGEAGRRGRRVRQRHRTVSDEEEANAQAEQRERGDRGAQQDLPPAALGRAVHAPNPAVTMLARAAGNGAALAP